MTAPNVAGNVNFTTTTPTPLGSNNSNPQLNLTRATGPNNDGYDAGNAANGAKYATYLKIFTGEMFKAYESACIAKGTVQNRTLRNGKAAQFIFTVCQIGTESALKDEIAREWPDFRFSYSRPGFVTFKLPEGFCVSNDFDLRSVFARTSGFSLGRVVDREPEHLLKQVWGLAGDRKYDALHCWQRDTSLPGDNGFEPGSSLDAAFAYKQLRQCAPTALLTRSRVKPGSMILDCMLIEPSELWVGYHLASSTQSRWPGGVPRVRRDCVLEAKW